MTELKQTELRDERTNTSQERHGASGVWPWIVGLLIFSVLLWMLVEGLDSFEPAKPQTAVGRISTVDTLGAHDA